MFGGARAAGNAIEVRGLVRRYGGPTRFEAVRGVSFQVARGELFALLGTNGAGKTSTLEVVEGLARPSAGEVRVLGYDPFVDRAKVRPRIGIMLQEGGFPPDLTVVETVRMWAGLLSRSQPVGVVLDLVRLDHRADVPVRQLSGGERRRLDLAVAVLGRPDVLFLDEPTTGLDPESRRDTWQFIRTLLHDGVTVALTTHYLDEAQELADQLAIMHQGTVVASGTVTEVIAAHPARISFTLPAGAAPLPDLPHARLPTRPDARPNQGEPSQRVTLHTTALQDTLTALLTWAAQAEIRLGGLDARPASLEEAFLAIADNDRSPEVAA